MAVKTGQTATKKEKGLEQTMQQVETLLDKLEDETTDLETSFTLYKEGMQLIAACNDMIDHIEKELIVIENGEDGEQ